MLAATVHLINLRPEPYEMNVIRLKERLRVIQRKLNDLGID